MWKLYKYGFLRMIRTKEIIFWVLAFPLILGTFLFLTFSGVDMGDFNPIPVGVVGDSNLAAIMESTGMMEVFELEYSEARQKLESSYITGFFYSNDDGVQLVVANTGVNQTILQTVGSQIIQRVDAMSTIAAINPAALADITWSADITNTSAVWNALTFNRFFVRLHS